MIERSAIISPCGLYRYQWRRRWYPKLAPFVVIGLNPATADHRREDNTSRGIWERAARLGYGEAILVNLGAGRATEPDDWMKMADPIGPENDQHLRDVFEESKYRGGIVVVGWGNGGTFMKRDDAVVKIAKRAGIPLACLGYTKERHPRHPLYVAKKTELVRYVHGKC